MLNIDEFLNSRPLTIEKLSISNCELNNLPDLSRFTSVKTLYCINNNIESFSGEFLPPSIKRLYFNCNKLNAIPENLPEGLTYLSCNYNKLTALPETLPDSLEVLWCNNNKITEMPSKMPLKLITLWCNNNLLTELPENLPITITFVNCFCETLLINHPTLSNIGSNHIYYIAEKNKALIDRQIVEVKEKITEYKNILKALKDKKKGTLRYNRFHILFSFM